LIKTKPTNNQSIEQLTTRATTVLIVGFESKLALIQGVLLNETSCCTTDCRAASHIAAPPNVRGALRGGRLGARSSQRSAHYVLASKQAHTQTNKQRTNKQTYKQINKQTTNKTQGLLLPLCFQGLARRACLQTIVIAAGYNPTNTLTANKQSLQFLSR
jgi:hypothetical protein